MSLVRDEIAHILLHVNAEAATSDPSQSPGVGGRAQRVRAALAPFVTDQRNLSDRDLVDALVLGVGDTEIKDVLTNAAQKSDGQGIRYLMMVWVGGQSDG